MEAETLFIVWLGIATVLGLNGMAAGAAAVLHVWRRRGSRGGRIILASLAAGLLPSSMVLAASVLENEVTTEGPLVVALGFSMMLAIATVLAVPGAVALTRMLDRPGDSHRAFE